MLDRDLIEILAADLRTNPGLIEKDWHVVRAIGVLASLDHGDVTPTFSGGTSLSKGWGLIKRFSEDIDFKVAMLPSGNASKDRQRRKAYRDHIIASLARADFQLAGDVRKANEHKFFSADFTFETIFDPSPGLRPHLRVEMSFGAPALPPESRPIRSLIGEAMKYEPEVVAFPCVDPVETAADKLSALAWRVCTRERGSPGDDPTIIRHLHDLAALGAHVADSADFLTLVADVVAVDTRRGGSKAPEGTTERMAMMLDRLERERFWSGDYDQYVRQVSFAKPGEALPFDLALNALRTIVERIGGR